ncbi:MBL fold metallo-hydrolase [Dactylosporangium matsuzakiense]|uniref:MBL fold metallo-hydrolase n=1 Tax=Dactylosporangium matsuzakiense TaxID=53360 RepID=A0A9W6NKL5_9ACTN|nr:MBL fold metallo-hydrolase [Dactylosporangium matsuzakiense]UWZ45751.1 MBL fold metallo-hydrolase [Dactylosporangium matsuzakiense]GLK99936.1 MBL fold metallo-hydrolase [Dactylosporangium matsuzakiense]
MRITKYTHACLRLEHDGGVLVIDPGVFSEAEALEGADAVLITHEHPDHVDLDKLRAAAAHQPTLTIHTHPDVEAQLTDLDADVFAVNPGDTFVAAGMTVRAHGGQHAVIHPDIPRIVNIAFAIDGPGGPIYHPGDSFHVPDEAIATLFAPVSAPWLKLSEAVDFVRAVRPERAFALHDSLWVDAGQQIVTGHMTRLSGTRYARLEPGTAI